MAIFSTWSKQTNARILVGFAFAASGCAPTHSISSADEQRLSGVSKEGSTQTDAVEITSLVPTYPALKAVVRLDVTYTSPNESHVCLGTLVREDLKLGDDDLGPRQAIVTAADCAIQRRRPNVDHETPTTIRVSFPLYPAGASSPGPFALSAPRVYKASMAKKLREIVFVPIPDEVSVGLTRAFPARDDYPKLPQSSFIYFGSDCFHAQAAKLLFVGWKRVPTFPNQRAEETRSDVLLGLSHGFLGDPSETMPTSLTGVKETNLRSWNDRRSFENFPDELGEVISLGHARDGFFLHVDDLGGPVLAAGKSGHDLVLPLVAVSSSYGEPNWDTADELLSNFRFLDWNFYNELMIENGEDSPRLGPNPSP